MSSLLNAMLPLVKRTVAAFEPCLVGTSSP